MRSVSNFYLYSSCSFGGKDSSFSFFSQFLNILRLFVDNMPILRILARKFYSFVVAESYCIQSDFTSQQNFVGSLVVLIQRFHAYQGASSICLRFYCLHDLGNLFLPLSFCVCRKYFLFSIASVSAVLWQLIKFEVVG